MINYHNKVVAFDAINSKLLSFECPVCFSEPRPYSVNFCVNGHFICKSCAKQLSNCPLCRTAIITCRNLMAEELVRKILADSTVKCKYLSCKVYYPVSLMEDHETVCLYRQITCPAVSKCNFKNNFFNIVAHKKKCPYARYVDGVIAGERTTFEIGSLNELFRQAEKFPTIEEFPTLCLIGIDVYGLMPCIRIVKHSRPNSDYSKWHFYPSSSALPSEAKKYVIEMNIESTNGHFVRRYVGNFSPVKTTMTDRCHQGLFLELTQSELASSVSNNNSLIFSAFIIDLQKEAIKNPAKIVESTKNYFSPC